MEEIVMFSEMAIATRRPYNYSALNERIALLATAEIFSLLVCKMSRIFCTDALYRTTRTCLQSSVVAASHSR